MAIVCSFIESAFWISFFLVQNLSALLVRRKEIKLLFFQKPFFLQELFLLKHCQQICIYRTAFRWFLPPRNVLNIQILFIA